MTHLKTMKNHDRNRIVFMEIEFEDIQDEEDEQAVVDLEAEIEVALEEIDNLRNTSKKLIKEIDIKKHQLLESKKNEEKSPIIT